MGNKKLKIEKLFVYGTLRHPRFQKEAFGRSIVGEPAVAKDYKRSSRLVRKEPYPVIIRHSGGRVRGSVLSVTPLELARADRYEDPMYTRRKVTLAGGVSVWAYVYEN